MDDFMDTIDPRIERNVHRTKTGVHRRVRMSVYLWRWSMYLAALFVAIVSILSIWA